MVQSESLKRFTIFAVLVFILGTINVFGHFLKDVTDFEHKDNEFIIRCGDPAVKIHILDESVFRLWLSPDGSFDYYNDYNSYMIEPGITSFSSPERITVNNDDFISVKTKKFFIKIEKTPFRFYLFRPDEKTILTCNPAEKTFDPDYLACFERDACGKKEHFFGLQVSKANTLDHRGKRVGMEDKNGNGWTAPFFMSTAGYGIFLHNEHGWSNLFNFKETVTVENIQKHGRIDLFFFIGDDFKFLINKYTQLTGTPPMPPIKHLGFHYLVQGTPISHYEAFPQWRKRGYPIDGCITFTDRAVITEKDIAKVEKTANQIHDLNGRFGFYFDLKPSPGTFKDVNPADRNYPHNDWNYFRKIIRERLIEKGVDWFWVDETDDYGRVDTCDERFPFHLYKVMSDELLKHTGQRPFLCGRGGYAGCQRFGYPWMGDLEYDYSTILANLNNGFIGVGFSTHDMAGAGLGNKSEEYYLNGVKLNLLNPITQCNAWVPNQKPSHRPWEWSENAEKVFKEFLELHYRLVPYFYSTAWQTHSTGIPAWRSLVLDYPYTEEYYTSDQIMVGDFIMAAPLYEKSIRDISLPPGDWYYYFNTKKYKGPMTIKEWQSSDDEYPVFIKAGAIIPQMQPMKYIFEKPVETLLVDIYPSDRSSFKIYEDDGTTMDYLNGKFRLTEIISEQGNKGIKLTLHTSGNYCEKSAKKLVFKVLAKKPANVIVNNIKTKRVHKKQLLREKKTGWGYFKDELTESDRVFIKLANDKKDQTVKIIF